MLINTAQVKQLAKDMGDKQCSSDFLYALNGKVKELISRAVKNANHFKRLTEKELM